MNARPTPARGRIETFDGVRGLLLILMLNTHVPVSGGFKLFHPQALSLVDAASGFVFMSGLMSGLVYGPAIARHGLLAGAGKVWRRAATITLYVLSLAAGLAVAAQIIPGARSAWGEWLGPLASPDAATAIVVGFLLLGPNYADILQPYVLYLAVAPLAIWLCLRGRARTVLAGSIALWAAVQFGATVPLSAALNSGFREFRPDLHISTAFNVFAWQLIFVTGLVIGTVGPAESWRALNRRWLVCLSLALLIACAVFKIALYEGGYPAYGANTRWGEMAEWGSKAWLRPAYIFNAAAAAFMLAWLLTQEGSNSNAALRATGGLANTFLNAPFLRLLGRHSLQVYVWHVILVYVVQLFVAQQPMAGELVANLAFVGLVALLAVPAVLRERRKVEEAGKLPSSRPMRITP